jgi:hypothetical protein
MPGQTHNAFVEYIVGKASVELANFLDVKSAWREDAIGNRFIAGLDAEQTIEFLLLDSICRVPRLDEQDAATHSEVMRHQELLTNISAAIGI